MSGQNSKNQAIPIPNQLTVKELAKRLQADVPEIIKKLMENGIMASINDTVDYDTSYIVAEELGFQIEPEELTSTEEVLTLEKLQKILRLEEENKENLKKRPPIITVLGHVDHGKTTLLDTLKKTRIAEKESGGITQHTSAYQVKKKGELITFIDTPGHEAFQGMRERGATVADIAILVVAADDGVKPQTEEVVKFLLENNIPTIVAINKVDKPEAKPAKVKQELAEHGLYLEGYGGEVPFVEISAKQNTGLDELLDSVLFLDEYYDFRANPARNALGIILESHKDSHKGPITTALIKTGTLKVGQDIIIGKIVGRARKLEDYSGKSIEQAIPSTPVTILGLPKAPQSNDILQVEENQEKLRRFSKDLKRGVSTMNHTAGEMQSGDLLKTINETKKKRLSIVLKADVRGTLEAIEQIIQTIDSQEINVEFVDKGVGSITETDVKMAQTGNAIIYGFNVNPTPVASRIKEDTGVKIKVFNVIYELIEDVKNEMSELLEPEIKRTDLGKLKVLAVFKSVKNGMVVGGKVISGKMVKGENLEIVRESEAVGVGKMSQLQQNKEDVREVKEGLECGVSFEGKGKIQEGDTLICYKEEEIKKKIK
ncbi:MAG: translation initiation factor IF-2 [Candidatus Moranbacteria bacterium]|nr:translation initiation factor IF-2 [Candidatus Moranbacteria bacterium]